MDTYGQTLLQTLGPVLRHKSHLGWVKKNLNETDLMIIVERSHKLRPEIPGQIISSFFSSSTFNLILYQLKNTLIVQYFTILHTLNASSCEIHLFSVFWDFNSGVKIFFRKKEWMMILKVCEVVRIFFSSCWKMLFWKGNDVIFVHAQNVRGF